LEFRLPYRVQSFASFRVFANRPFKIYIVIEVEISISYSDINASAFTKFPNQYILSEDMRVPQENCVIKNAIIGTYHLILQGIHMRGL
jgi:hypothetical protein